MRIITTKVVTAYRQDYDKLRMFHKLNLPQGICLGFSESIEGHERDISFGNKIIKAVRCFWLKGNSTFVIYISLSERNKMVGDEKNKRD